MTNHGTGTRNEWLAARLELLEEEKELTRRRVRPGLGAIERDHEAVATRGVPLRRPVVVRERNCGPSPQRTRRMAASIRA